MAISFHRESPAEAHDRVTMLAHEGVHIERIRAKECNTLEAAMLCAQRLLMVLEKVKEIAVAGLNKR